MKLYQLRDQRVNPKQALICIGVLITVMAHGQSSFPETWEGYWTGALEIVGPRGIQRRVPMQMQIEKADSAGQWIWITTYGAADTPSVRKDYLLIEEDPVLGRYRIDEQNSIVMPAFLFGGNTLVCWFEVEGSLIQSIYERQPDGTMRFRIFAGDGRSPYTSGGDTLVSGEVIPKVMTYPVSTIQQAVLQRE